MSDPKDRLRALLRRATDGASAVLRDPSRVSRWAETLKEKAKPRAHISERDLTARLARTPEIAELSLVFDAPWIGVDARYDDGFSLRFAVAPSTIRFATGGSKEISFALRGVDSSQGLTRAGDLVCALGAAIAQALWSPVTGEVDGSGAPIVERSEDAIVIDLRALGAVREALRRAGSAILIDTISPEDIAVEGRALVVTLARPGLRRP